MKYYSTLCLTLTFSQIIRAVQHNIICYYDAASEDRKGLGQFTLQDLENALEFCTHVIYGYVGLNSSTFELSSLQAERDIGRQHFRRVTALKDKYPRTKFLLSLGGDKDMALDLPNKYIQLLEADTETHRSFLNSALHFLLSNKFDGLDLAFQFPRTKNNSRAGARVRWKSLRKLFTKKLNESENYQTEFALFVEKLRKALKPHDLMLSLTVLPNINARVFFNASALITNLDFINLQTFDFTTPELSPTEATYTAPLSYLPVQGNINVEHTIDYQVNYWLSQRVPPNKINVGIAAYGRAWKMSNDSNVNGYPTVKATNGSAPASYIVNVPGILTWTEICAMLVNALNSHKTGAQAPLYSVLDPHKDFVTYAFRPADINGEYGMWVSYDDPKIAAIKATYVQQRRLGGIALYDVSLDDFHGVCNGDTFPMLRYIKYIFS